MIDRDVRSLFTAFGLSKDNLKPLSRKNGNGMLSSTDGHLPPFIVGRIADYVKPPCNTIEGHTYAVRSVCVSNDGKHIISGSSDMTIKVWNIQTGFCEMTLGGHTDFVTSVCFSSDGSLVSASKDTTIKVWYGLC